MDENWESFFSKEFLDYLFQLVKTYVQWLIPAPQAHILKLCETEVCPQLAFYLKNEALPGAIGRAAQNETENDGAEGLGRFWEEMGNRGREKVLGEVKLIIYKLGSEQAIYNTVKTALHELQKQRENKNTKRFEDPIKFISFFPKLSSNQQVILSLWLMHNIGYRATAAVYCSWPKDLSVKRRNELLDEIVNHLSRKPRKFMSQAARNQKTSRAVKMFKDYFFWLKSSKLKEFPACLYQILSDRDEIDCEPTDPSIYTIDVALSWLRHSIRKE